MKKKFLALAITLLAMSTVTASAKKSEKAPQQNCPVAQCAQQQCQACDSLECAGGQMLFFEGIELTPDQQTKLQAIKPQRPDKGMRGERRSRPQGQPRQFAGQPGDSAKFKQAPGQRPNRMQGRRDYINQVKEILTPEQYVIFLENMVTATPAPQQGMRPCNDQRGTKPQKGQKAQKARKLDKAADTKVASNRR